MRYSFLGSGSIMGGKFPFLPRCELGSWAYYFLNCFMCTIPGVIKMKCSLSPDLSHTFTHIYVDRLVMRREPDTGKGTFSRTPVRLKHEGTKRPKYQFYSNGREKKKSCFYRKVCLLGINNISLHNCVGGPPTQGKSEI